MALGCVSAGLAFLAADFISQVAPYLQRSHVNNSKYMHRYPASVGALALALVLSSCSVTTGSIEGTTASFDNTIGASIDFSEASTKLTSSTSGTGDHDSKNYDDSEEIKDASAFIERNYNDIRRDIARGSGEHLISVATIFGLSTEQTDKFCELSKAHYKRLFVEKDKDPLSLAYDFEEIAHFSRKES